MNFTEKVKITNRLNPSDTERVPLIQIHQEQRRRLEMLYELPVQFAEEPDLKRLLNLILQKTVDLIKNAKRAALLILDNKTNELVVRATIPMGEVQVSKTLIQRCVEGGFAFTWSREEEQDVTDSMVFYGIEAGMYVPMLWQGHIMGVICVDNPRSKALFGEDDLRFLMSIAHYAASAVANQQLRDRIEYDALVMQRLLINFSPKLRRKLLGKARAGGLEPGGEKSDVTILFSDIRGFTKITSDWDAEHVMDLLNDYFALLIEAIFEHDGTIDKFVGDGIIAVFGSPERDPDHPAKAIQAAQAMQEAMAIQNKIRADRGETVCEIGIGIHTGTVLHGFVGSVERLEFTVIGEAVNKASRYCSGAKGGEIIVSPEVYGHTSEKFDFQEAVVPTKHEGDFLAYKVRPASQ